MISADMRKYNYFTYGEPNEYGQKQLGKEPKGEIRMAIYTTSQTIQDNINYKGATYLGLTNDAKVDDTYVIGYGNEQLKVMYVSPAGRYKQVFMEKM